MPELVIETERLVLRTMDERDAALHHRILNTPATMQFLGGVKELHEIEAKHALSLKSFASDGYGFMTVIEKASGDLVGHAGLKKVNNANAANQGDFEIGWLIREDRWRLGYATEVMGAIIEWAFIRHGAPHLVALTSKRNEASWRLMEKLGMERRQDLDFVDPAFPPGDQETVQYMLTREQWEQRK